MDLKNISRRVAACAARIPTSKRTPKLCIVFSGDPNAEKNRRAAEAVGDPILNVTLLEPTDADEFAALNPNP